MYSIACHWGNVNYNYYEVPLPPPPVRKAVSSFDRLLCCSVYGTKDFLSSVVPLSTFTRARDVSSVLATKFNVWLHDSDVLLVRC